MEKKYVLVNIRFKCGRKHDTNAMWTDFSLNLEATNTSGGFYCENPRAGIGFVIARARSSSTVNTDSGLNQPASLRPSIKDHVRQGDISQGGPEWNGAFVDFRWV